MTTSRDLARDRRYGMRLATMVAAVLIAAACGGSSADPGLKPSPSPGLGPLASQADPLKDAATAADKWVGVAVQSGYLANEPEYAAAVARHADYLTAEYEMKMDPIANVRGQFEFTGADAIVAFAQANQMKVKGHALVWHGATPAWVSALSPADLRSTVADYIKTVVSRYRGRVAAWDVVNEAVAEDGSGLRDSVFLQKLGPGYIADAFRAAHAADPTALLFYNDYSGEGLGAKSDRIYELAKRLRSSGVPIDGVGLQMHIEATGYPAEADMTTNVKRLVALGLLVNISEMDVRVAHVPGDEQARLAAQRTRYHDIVAVCVAEPKCHAVTLWGLTDLHTWIDSVFGPDQPLPFDETYHAKPAFFGIQDAFLGR